jgi:LPXTG-motif cell wall-anchored protein
MPCRKEEPTMDTSMIVRVIAGVLFVAVLGFLILRRKRKSA